MNVVICGYGKMGQTLERFILDKDDFDIVGIVGKTPFCDVLNELDEIDSKIDCIIDFSHRSFTDHLLTFCQRRCIPVVIATTGHTDFDLAKIKSAANSVPIVLTTNTSIGITMLTLVLKYFAKMQHDLFDIEIIEKHHRLKLDSPSGTADMFLNVLHEEIGMQKGLKKKHGRKGQKLRDKNEIGIHSVRGGTISGEHSVIFAGTCETVELKHTAHNKQLYASGALRAARFLLGKPPKLYQMKDVLVWLGFSEMDFL